MNALKNSVLTSIGFTILSLPVSAKPIAPGDMIAYCRGEAVNFFGTGPKYIKTGSLIRNTDGSYTVNGTVDLGSEDKSFRCDYDQNGEFKGVIS